MHACAWSQAQRARALALPLLSAPAPAPALTPTHARAAPASHICRPQAPTSPASPRSPRRCRACSPRSRLPRPRPASTRRWQTPSSPTRCSCPRTRRSRRQASTWPRRAQRMWLRCSSTIWFLATTPFLLDLTAANRSRPRAAPTSPSLTSCAPTVLAAARPRAARAPPAPGACMLARCRPWRRPWAQLTRTRSRCCCLAFFHLQREADRKGEGQLLSRGRQGQRPRARNRHQAQPAGWQGAPPQLQPLLACRRACGACMQASAQRHRHAASQLR